MNAAKPKADKIVTQESEHELVEESTKKDEAETAQESNLKRDGDELKQERSKKQNVKDNKESEELKEIIPGNGDNVTIDAIPSSVRYSTIDLKGREEKLYPNF
uniref:Uncharacterized protein n=1 Tax=Tanacetum cinerariifolium TaxID=118510 RepID=A0A6L2N8B9_TANCI|nr:hypothetical protein [Tanacetum cinerariifolium]